MPASQRSHRRALGVACLGAIALGAALAPVAAASVPTPAPAPAPGRSGLALVAQDAWTPIGGDLHLDIRVPEAIAAPGATVSLVAYQPVTTRTAFDRVVTGGTPSSVIDQVVVPLADLAPGPSATRAIAVGIEATNAPRDPDRLSLRRTGVYPLAVEVLDADEQSQGRFVTMVVAVAVDLTGSAPPVVGSRLGVAWTWPLVAGPSTLPDGSPDTEVTEQLRPDGRLGRQAVALTRAGDLPLTLVPGPETLEAWVRAGAEDPAIARGAAAVRDAATRDQTVSGPYVPTDLPSLLGVGLVGTVDAELVHGDETLARLLGTRPDVRTAVSRPVDASALGRLRAHGVDRVVIDGNALAAAGRSAPVRPFLLQPAPSLVPGEPIDALAGDATINRLLQTTGSPAVRAQRALAWLAVIALEEPNAARAVTILNPVGFDPPATMLDALLTGLRGNPLLEPMTVDEVFARIPGETSANGTPSRRELAPYAPPAPPVGALAYAATQQRLASFRSLAGPVNAVVTHGDRSLLVCEAATFIGPAGTLRARATLESIDVGIDAFVARIRIPRPSTITLTSRSGEIPLTFRNDTGQPLQVSLELGSAKLTFPEGSTRSVALPTKSTTVRVPVESRTSGTFPLHLDVTSADGAFPVGTSTFRVRSTAFSTVGILLMVSAALFLVVWWALHIRRGRRTRPAP